MCAGNIPGICEVRSLSLVHFFKLVCDSYVSHVHFGVSSVVCKNAFNVMCVFFFFFFFYCRTARIYESDLHRHNDRYVWFDVLVVFVLHENECYVFFFLGKPYTLAKMYTICGCILHVECSNRLCVF